MEVQSLQVNRNASAQTAVVGTDQQGKSTKEKARRKQEGQGMFMLQIGRGNP
jgi:hypothetical protein